MEMMTKPEIDHATDFISRCRYLDFPRSLTRASGDPWQKAVAEGIDTESGRIVSNVYQELMPSLRRIILARR